MNKESLFGSVWQLLTGFNNGPHNEHPGKVSQLMDPDCLHKQFLQWINGSWKSASSHWNTHSSPRTNDWMNVKHVFTFISPLFEQHTSAYLSYLTSMLLFGGQYLQFIEEAIKLVGCTDYLNGSTKNIQMLFGYQIMKCHIDTIFWITSAASIMQVCKSWNSGMRQ